MLTGTAEANKVGAGAIPNSRHLNELKIELQTITKHLRGFLWRKMLIIDCETW